MKAIGTQYGGQPARANLLQVGGVRLLPRRLEKKGMGLGSIGSISTSGHLEMSDLIR